MSEQQRQGSSEYVRVLYDWSDTGKDCLEIHAGDIVSEVDRADDDWYFGVLNEKWGYFPSNYCEPYYPIDTSSRKEEEDGEWEENSVFQSTQLGELSHFEDGDAYTTHQSYNNTTTQESTVAQTSAYETEESTLAALPTFTTTSTRVGEQSVSNAPGVSSHVAVSTTGHPSNVFLSVPEGHRRQQTTSSTHSTASSSSSSSQTVVSSSVTLDFSQKPPLVKQESKRVPGRGSFGGKTLATLVTFSHTWNPMDWSKWTHEKRRRFLHVSYAVFWSVALFALAIGLGVDNGKSQSLINEDQFQQLAGLAIDDTVKRVFTTDANGQPTTLRLSERTFSGGNVRCLLKSIGIDDDELSGTVTTASGESFLAEFGEYSLDGEHEFEFETLPYKQYQVTTDKLFGRPLTIGVAIFVTGVVFEDFEYRPIVEIALRIDMATVTFGDIVQYIPYVQSGTWMNDMTFLNGNHLVVSTGPVKLPLAQLRKGVNAKFSVVPPDGSGNTFLDQFHGMIQVKPPATAISVEVQGSLDFRCLDDGSIDPSSNGGSFDVTLMDAKLRMGQLGIDVDRVTVRANGLGRGGAPVTMKLLADVGFVTPPDDGGYIHARLLGDWTYDGNILLAGYGYNITMPKIDDYVKFSDVSVSAEFGVTDVSVRLNSLNASLNSYLYLSNVVGKAPFTLSDRPLRMVGTFMQNEVGFVSATPLFPSDKGAVAYGLRKIICQVGGYCNKPIQLLDDMGIPDDTTLRASVATRPTFIDSTLVPAGFALFTETPFDFPASVTNVLSHMGVTDPRARVGANMPFDVPREFRVFAEILNVANPADSDGVVSTDTLEWSRIGLEMRPLESPPYVTLISSVLVHNIADEPLKFSVAGHLTAGASAILEGYMEGVWRSVGGVKGLDISNCGASIGVSALYGLSEVGLWGDFEFGDVTGVNFTVIISPARGKYGFHAVLNDLTLGNIVEFACKTADLDLVVDLSAVASTIDKITRTEFRHVDIKIAPYSFTLGGKTFTAGFHIKCDILWMGATVNIHIGKVVRTKNVLDKSVQVNDFLIDYALRDLTLSNMVPALRFGNYIISYLQSKIQQHTRLCLASICKNADISGVMSYITGHIDNLVTINAMTLGNFYALGAVLGDTPMPVFSLNVTLLSKDYVMEKEIDIDFLSNYNNAVPSQVWSKFENAFSNFKSNLREDLLEYYCTKIKTACVTITAVELCVSIPGISC